MRSERERTDAGVAIVRGYIDISAFLRVRSLVYQLKAGENEVFGDEDSLIELPKDWPLPPPKGFEREFQGNSQLVIDRAIAAGTFGLTLEQVIIVVENTKTTREAVVMAAGMRMLMGG
jgi:hypothetical protein